MNRAMRQAWKRDIQERRKRKKASDPSRARVLSSTTTLTTTTVTALTPTAIEEGVTPMWEDCICHYTLPIMNLPCKNCEAKGA